MPSGQETGLSFAKELWDGFDAISIRTEEGLASYEEIYSFFKKSAALCDEFGKSLIRLCKSSSTLSFSKRVKTSGVTINVKQGTIGEAFEGIKQKFLDLGQKHSDLSDLVGADICRPIKDFIKDNSEKRRQLVVEGQNFTKDLQNAYSVHEKTLSNRNKFKKTTYKAKLELDEAEKKGKAEKIAKKKIKHDQDKEKSEQAELQYKEAVKELDFHQTKWLSDAMPRILTELQSIEEKRLFIYKNTMISLSGFFEGLPQFFTNCGNTIHQLSNAINPTADLQTFIDENRTDDVPPPQIKYEEWSPNMDEKKRKKEAAAIFSIGKKKAPAKSKKPLPAVAPSTVAASNVPPVNIESIRRPTPDDPVLSPRTKDELKKPKAKVPEGGLTKVQEARIKMEADAAKAKATEFKKRCITRSSQ